MEVFTCQFGQPSSLPLRISETIYSVTCTLLYAIFLCLFAEVGIVIGAMAGAFIGLKTKRGLLHGAVVGATSGCILSSEVFNVALRLLDSQNTGIECVSSLIKTIVVISQRFVQDRLTTTTQVPQESRNEVPRLKSTKKVQKIRRLTDNNIVETLWHGPCCSICLQDIQLGDMACSLAKCGHVFHPSCICKWLVLHRSCPLCRTKL